VVLAGQPGHQVACGESAAAGRRDRCGRPRLAQAVSRCASRLAGAVVLPAALLTAFTLTMPRDIGLRYLLPVMALWAVLAGALVPR